MPGQILGLQLGHPRSMVQHSRFSPVQEGVVPRSVQLRQFPDQVAVRQLRRGYALRRGVRRGEEVPAGLFGEAARLRTDSAVLVVLGVVGAFVGTRTANLSACVEQGV